MITPYFLFVSFQSGLKHNHLYDDIVSAYDEISVICEEECFINTSEIIPSFPQLNQHLQVNDDFEMHLPNGTWIHLQPFLQS